VPAGASELRLVTEVVRGRPICKERIVEQLTATAFDATLITRSLAAAGVPAMPPSRSCAHPFGNQTTVRMMGSGKTASVAGIL